jgi:hypothetical protein
MKLLIFFISLNLFAHVPTEESLLRNNQKKIYQKNTTVYSFRINFQEVEKPKVVVENIEDKSLIQNEIPVVEAVLEEPLVDEEGNIVKKIVNKERFIKFITKKETAKLEQILYKNSISNSNIVDYQEFALVLKQENVKFNQQLFYAILNIISRSDSEYFIKLMKKSGIDLNTNTDLLNIERKDLMERQKDFLSLTKDLTDDEIVGSEMKSPLIAETDEDQEKVDNLLKEKWIKNSPNVSLIKKGNKLYWELKTLNLNAAIENETRRIEYIDFKYQDSTYNISFNKYLLFQGQYDLPQLTLIKKDGNIIFEMNLLKLFNFDESIENIMRRKSTYNKSIKANKKGLEFVEKPGFLI